MRPEGVVGWAALSLILYWRRSRYLALPAALYLAIGLSWGAYKYRYTGEFSMTTNTVGDNAWISLWQAPSKFRWQTADHSYFEWAAQRRRSSYVQARLRHRRCARWPASPRPTPSISLHLALHKFLQFVDVNAFNAAITYPRVVYERLRGPPVWSLMGVVAVCVLLPHERRRTLFLGWPLFFNLPLFLVLLLRRDAPRRTVQRGSASSTAVPPLLEAGFYRALWHRRRRTLAVAVTFVTLWFLAPLGRSGAARLRSLALLDAVPGPGTVRVVSTLSGLRTGLRSLDDAGELR